jgi:RHS repeat-associated protein
VRDLIDDDGSTIAHFVYDSFGAIVGGGGSLSAGDLGFAGREYSPVSGTWSIRAREYDPGSGRFLQRDPVDPFRHEYAANDPLMYVDLDGRAPGISPAWIVRAPTNPAHVVPNYWRDHMSPIGRPPAGYRPTGNGPIRGITRKPAYRPSPLEYGLLASLIGVAIIETLSWVGHQVELEVDREADLLERNNIDVFGGR